MSDPPDAKEASEAMRRHLARLTQDMALSDHNAPVDPGSAPDASPGLPRELQAVDTLLARQAARLSVPLGLLDRVLDASVALLPRRRSRGRSLRLDPVVVGGSPWSRLAMAASLGLAFLVASQLIRAPQQLLSPEVELVLLGDAHDTRSGLDRLLMSAEEPQFGEVEHLLLTRDMTIRDLDRDLALLAADLGM